MLKVLENCQPQRFRANCNGGSFRNIKFGPPQSPPTSSPGLKHTRTIWTIYYHLESVHLSHLIIRLRLTKQANIAALEAWADAKCLDQKLLTEAYMAIKHRGVIFQLLKQEVSDHFREMPESAPTAVGRIISSFTLILLNPPCREENFSH